MLHFYMIITVTLATLVTCQRHPFPMQPPGVYPFQRNVNFYSPQQPQFQSPDLPQNIASSQCKSIQFTKRRSNGWYGKIAFKSPSDSKAANVDVEFDEPIIVFINDYAPASSLNNKLFHMKNESPMKRGAEIKIEFFAKQHSTISMPPVTKLKFNELQICPEEIQSDGCAKIEMLSNGTGGRWDGELTIYAPPYRNFQVILEFDESVWALGTDLGDSVTSDQKRFTINSFRTAQPGEPLIVNFFVKFDIFLEIPQIKQIFIDGESICIANDARSSTDATMSSKLVGNLLLTDIPFDKYPNVLASPQQVFNQDYECGISENVVASRINSGNTAQESQFPFHAALFYDLQYQCGSSLVSEKAVISAAHCVVNAAQNVRPSEKFRLLFGSVDFKELTGHEALRNVSRIIKHPDYEYNRVYKRDIAILMIEGNLQFSQYIRPICLPDSLTPPMSSLVNKELEILGFGSSTESMQLSRYLIYGQMTVISRKECDENIILALLPEYSTFCAKAKDDVLACKGDSGGAMLQSINKKYYIRGIVSESPKQANGRCSLENPVAFTDVSAFTNWIRENI